MPDVPDNTLEAEHDFDYNYGRDYSYGIDRHSTGHLHGEGKYYGHRRGIWHGVTGIHRVREHRRRGRSHGHVRNPNVGE